MTHAELVQRAAKWLRRQGCSVVIDDRMRACTGNGEQPDAIGWRDSVSILVEAKTSRADFLADARKRVRRYPTEGMGHWRFYICPKGLIQPDELPDGWGLIWCTARQSRVVAGGPKGNWWGGNLAFPEVAWRSELAILLSALRRLDQRGHLPEVYAPLPRPAVDGDIGLMP